MVKINKLLDINKLESLELRMGSEKFSKFICNFILEIESNIKEIEKSADISDFDNLMKLTDSMKIETFKMGETLLNKEIIKLQNVCLKKQKPEILKSVKKMKKVSEKTINVVQDISLLTTYLYLCHRK
ncbi:MAG: hypothetical protein FWE50_02955 [Alphaproteobacteria bacterium]|nr:hypothetical protein [Alphaproteobacteria bacterium]